MRQQLQLDSLTDHGVWISDDRVAAFVTPRGLGEIDYHGQQPVSRNARILLSATGVLTFHVQGADASWLPIALANLLSYPAGVEYCDHPTAPRLRISITAAGRKVLIRWVCAQQKSLGVALRFSRAALFSQVQGERTWRPPQRVDNTLYLRCRDRLVLRDWLRRSGPYAGDFLIPEPWRRIIFSRRCRSGLATFADAHPEFREADLPLYDAEIFVRLGGVGFSVHEENGDFVFRGALDGQHQPEAIFTIVFADRAGDFSEPLADEATIAQVEAKYAAIVEHAPQLVIPEYPAITRFFAGVPALVESCRVQDFGMCRANPGAYYWLWGWDNLVTAHEISKWGDVDNLKRMIQFVGAHRDADGRIPGRWTRSLQPLDTPPAGALDFLFATLVEAYTRASGDLQPLLDAYPYFLAHFHATAASMDAEGRFANIGYYPDLLVKFGRSENSAVAMEVAAFYSFCRILETLALRLGDNDTARKSRVTAACIQTGFLPTFWDDSVGFFCDALDLATGERNASYPLFTLLFLQTPAGLALLRGKLHQAAAFVSTHHLTPHGTALVPRWDKNRESESALASWYPHWDIYLTKLLRRTGQATAILRWLQNVEKTLSTLGYCPEFLALGGFENGDPNAWQQHGAISNLNCATGWYRALLEGVLGLEVDAGGITIIPLSLPLPEVELQGLRVAGAIWHLRAIHGGPYLQALRIDGTEAHGCCKIPHTFADGGEHVLEIIYGSQVRREGTPQIRELINAEVLATDARADEIAVQVRCLGTTDLVFRAPQPGQLIVDGKPQKYGWDAASGQGTAQLALYGEHEIIITSAAAV